MLKFADWSNREVVEAKSLEFLMSTINSSPETMPKLMIAMNKFADVLHVLRECGRCDASVLLCMALEEAGLLDQLPERSEQLRLGAALTTKLLKEALFMVSVQARPRRLNRIFTMG